MGTKHSIATVTVSLALGLAACSGGSSDGGGASEATALSVKELRARPCGLVTTIEAATIIGAPVLAKAQTGDWGFTRSCAYVADPTGTAPRGGTSTTSTTTSTTTPGQDPDPPAGKPGPSDLEPLTATISYDTGASKGATEAVLPAGTPVKDLGDEARFDPTRAARGPRLAVRDGGLVLLLELGPTADGPDEVQKQLVELARAALKRTPTVKPVSEAKATAGGTPCEALGDGKDLGKDLDAQVTVSPAPGGACSLAITGAITAQVTPMVVEDAAAAVKDFAQSSGEAEWPRTDVDVGDGGAWLANPDTDGNGSLLAASGDEVFTVVVTVPGGTADDAQGVATAIAEAITA